MDLAATFSTNRINQASQGISHIGEEAVAGITVDCLPSSAKLLWVITKDLIQVLDSDSSLEVAGRSQVVAGRSLVEVGRNQVAADRSSEVADRSSEVADHTQEEVDHQEVEDSEEAQLVEVDQPLVAD